DYGVDVRAVDHLAIIQKSIALEVLGAFPFALLVNVADRNHFAVIGALADSGERSRQVCAAAADSNHADLDAIIGADDAARGCFGGMRAKGLSGYSERRH